MKDRRMPLKPRGLLKRCSNDENTEPTQKKKKMKLVDITNSPLPNRNGFFKKTPLENKTLIQSAKLRKSSSLFTNQSGPQNTLIDNSKLTKSISLPTNQSGLVQEAQQTSQLEAALEIVKKMHVENDLHGFDGSQIMKIRQAENHFEIEHQPFDLPFNFYSSFDAYTSEDDNFGLSLESLAELWLSYMKHLVSMISEEFFPSPLILHGIVHRGLVHASHEVRQICSEYLYTLLFQIHQPRNCFYRTKYLNLFFTNQCNEESKDNDCTQAWDTFSSVFKEYLDISNNDRMSGNTLMTRYLVKLLEVDVEYWCESRCLKEEGKMFNNLEEKTLLEMILWPEGDCGQINFRVKMLLRYYADALGSKKKSQMEPFRQLVSMVAKVVTTVDAECKEDSRKLSLADYFAKELRHGLDELSEQKLWFELYMLEPDWLAVKICQKLAHDACPFFDSRGLREISNVMETLTISQSTGNATMSIPIMDDEANLSESNMDVIENKNVIASDATGDAKTDNTNSTGSQSIMSKDINRVWLNKYGETHLHISCRKGEVKKVEELLEDQGDELISLVDHNGWSCLHEAIAHERLECVRMLLNFESSCDILVIKSIEDGLTPLHDAVSNGYVDIAEVLMENFSKRNRVEEALSCLTGDGLTVFQLSTIPAMSELLLKYQKSAAAVVVPVAPPTTLSLPTKRFFKVSNPSRLTVILASYVYRYVSCFQIHTVQTLMVKMNSQKPIRSPIRLPRLTSQDLVNAIHKPDYYYRETSIHRTKKIVAEDVLTNVKFVSKSKFRKFFVIHT